MLRDPMHLGSKLVVCESISYSIKVVDYIKIFHIVNLKTQNLFSCYFLREAVTLICTPRDKTSDPRTVIIRRQSCRLIQPRYNSKSPRHINKRGGMDMSVDVI